MDFRRTHFTGLRDTAIEFFAEHVTPESVDRAHATGTWHDPALHAAMARSNRIGAWWPTEAGGRGLEPFEMGAWAEAAYYCEAPIVAQVLTETIGWAIIHRGSDELRASLLPAIVRGELLIALGFTEADAGSDLAAVQTKAVPVDGGYMLNGSKMFTTMAHAADYIAVLARTDPSAPKHRGLSMLLVPTTDPGVEVAAIQTFGGERTNASFFDCVFVPDTHRIGEENDGWGVLTLVLDAERANVGGYVGEARRVFDDLVDSLTTIRPDAIESCGVRRQLAEWNARIEAAAALADRVYCRLRSNNQPTVEAAMTKLAVTEVFKDLAHAALAIAGPEALLCRGQAAAPAGGSLEHSFRHAQIATIYGGANEIQRNIIARRGLGLPKSD